MTDHRVAHAIDLMKRTCPCCGVRRTSGALGCESYAGHLRAAIGDAQAEGDDD